MRIEEPETSDDGRRPEGTEGGEGEKRIEANKAVIETHTKNVRFCILCNYVNKITPAIQSRCTRFRFSPLPEKEVQRKVDQVIDNEGWVFFSLLDFLQYFPPLSIPVTCDQLVSLDTPKA